MIPSYTPTKRRLIKGALSTFALAGLTVATAAPAVAAAPSGNTGQAGVYVALGDSMASGPLIPDITGPIGCGRSTHNYAHELKARIDPAAFRDVTCSGASTKHMTESQDTSVLGQSTGIVPPQFDALSADTTLVTMTIGGNDTGLVGVAQDCVRVDPTAKPCKDDYTEGGVDKVAERVKEFEPKLSAVLDGIRQRSPNARVVLTGYGLYIKPGGCWPTQPVLPVDADYLQASVNLMNGVIERQAAAHGATYVDLVGPSQGHDTCQSSSKRWIEGYVPTNLAAPLHPNRSGEENYARIIGDRIGA
ncbi:SGNH/GDSL hydrolase family protein [Actinomadura xylanilytica]|uniref:SGNH/GDSL hydrolase family protein n=1 Tax=Actinomadura xylanilytica TaxID=887459 RepID=UPI00255B3C9E|nr:SGNH/GDSL hydrolase family protein [Actinomadura xylanilytica]MDL4775390.1 SGNH/GDSL hydrolase family protein [Actinomadura xylanilytica]